MAFHKARLIRHARIEVRLPKDKRVKGEGAETYQARRAGRDLAWAG